MSEKQIHLSIEEKLLNRKSSKDIISHDFQSSYSLQQTENQVDSNGEYVNENWDHIYDIPNMSQVNRIVLTKLFTVSGVAIIFLIAEVVGGVISGSLAILSDAAHMFSDISGFIISIFSVWVGMKPASKRLSFGYHRSEVVGALASIILIWGLTFVLIYEAIYRMINRESVEEPLFMLITAGFGLICNIIMAKILHSSPTGHSHSGCSHGHDHRQDHSHDQINTVSHSHNKKNKNKMSDINENKTEKSKKQMTIIHNEDHHRNPHHCEHDHNHSDHDHNHHSDHDQKHREKKQDRIPFQNHCDQEDHIHNHENEQMDHYLFQNKNTDKKQNQYNIGCSSHEKGQYKENQNTPILQESRQHNINKDSIISGVDSVNIGSQNNKKSTNLSMIESKDNYNLRAAMIHVIGDIIQSIGVLIAAIMIYFFGGNQGFNYWHYADPICTFIFSIIVVFTTFSVGKDCVIVLLEGIPSDFDITMFRESLLSVENVVEVHDLHVWSLSKGKPAMSCHIFVNKNLKKALKDSTRICRQLGIYHSTIQIEHWSEKGNKNYIKCDHNIHK